MKIEPFTFDRSSFQLRVLDQTRLPQELRYVDVRDVRDGFDVIKRMLVRGAPCIAAVGCLSIISELNNGLDLSAMSNREEFTEWLNDKAAYLSASRPTAVNLKHALDRLVNYTHERENSDPKSVRAGLTQWCIAAIDAGLVANKQLSEYGANRLLWVSKPHKLSILTHCNTGALATVGHGTALGIIRTLHEFGKLQRAYCTETRPYNQGSRLTAWELVQEEIPATLIADDMVAHLMETHNIDAVVVGADRVAANGDTANKIGTLQIAVIAKHYKVPFYVAAPTQTIDLNTKSAAAIVIEQRPAEELRRIGNYQLAPDSVDVWNPCFDVTPAVLIDGIITEYGVCETGELVNFLDRIRPTISEDALF